MSLEKLFLGEEPKGVKVLVKWSDGKERPFVPVWAITPDGVLSVPFKTPDETQLTLARIGPGTATITVTVGSVSSPPLVVEEPPPPTVVEVSIEEVAAEPPPAVAEQPPA